MPFEIDPSIFIDEQTARLLSRAVVKDLERHYQRAYKLLLALGTHKLGRSEKSLHRLVKRVQGAFGPCFIREMYSEYKGPRDFCYIWSAFAVNKEKQLCVGNCCIRSELDGLASDTVMRFSEHALARAIQRLELRTEGKVLDMVRSLAFPTLVAAIAAVRNPMTVGETWPLPFRHRDQRALLCVRKDEYMRPPIVTTTITNDGRGRWSRNPDILYLENAIYAFDLAGTDNSDTLMAQTFRSAAYAVSR